MSNIRDIDAILEVLEHYKKDGMGQSPEFTPDERERLKEQFKTYPKVLVFLAYCDDDLAGGVVSFNTFATFAVKDIINIHDICVLKAYRGLGVGRKLMDAVISKAKEIDCSKVTLEVREDNEVAQSLYSSLGFIEATPVMHFWHKPLF